MGNAMGIANTSQTKGLRAREDEAVLTVGLWLAAPAEVEAVQRGVRRGERHAQRRGRRLRLPEKRVA